MNEVLKAKVLVLGGGPGGYVAAIRAGQLGLDTVLVEGDRLGGTCLIRGCIPSKALIHAASEFAAVRRARDVGALGIRVTGEVSLDFSQTVQWKDGVVDRLNAGVASLLRRAKVRVVNGWGIFLDAKTCQVAKADGSQVRVEAENVILAAGSEATELPQLPFGGDVISSTEALSLPARPDRLVVVGGGYIGLELGMAFGKLGSQVVVVEAQDRILPQYDAALTAPLAKALARDGIAVELKAKAGGFVDGELIVNRADGASIRLPADKVLVAAGRRPRTRGWGLEAMAVDLVDGFVKIDDQCRTSMKGVWAIGDLVGDPMLAHKASAQGETVAEVIAGHKRRFAPVAIPEVCFTDPEVVLVGAGGSTEGDVAVATFPLSANGRALSLEGDKDGGFVRIVADPVDHRVLGFAAVGKGVSDLAGEMAALLEMGAVLEDVAGVIHAHPSQSEMLQESAFSALKRPIHA